MAHSSEENTIRVTEDGWLGGREGFGEGRGGAFAAEPNNVATAMITCVHICKISDHLKAEARNQFSLDWPLTEIMQLLQ